MAHSKEHSNLSKFETLQALLKQGHVLAHVDPSISGTVLPQSVKKNPSVSLKLDYAFRGNLELNDKQVLAELLFAGTYFSCVLPLEAIWAATDQTGKNHLWPNTPAQQILATLLQAVSTQSASPPQQKPKKVKNRKGSHLTRVK